MLTKVNGMVPENLIVIKADGSIEPVTANITTLDFETYRFTYNIFNWSIIIERSNIIIDGNGYALEGTGSSYGFGLANVTNVTIKNVTIKNFYFGIILGESDGVEPLFSSNNTIVGNNITNNYCGIMIMCGVNNKFYHNNFINNTYPAVLNYEQPNVWDNGYPSGGNYWSDYTGADLKSGPYQNETGSDGIGDTPYNISLYNQDRYPLITPYIIPEFPSTQTLFAFLIIITLISVLASKEFRKKEVQLNFSLSKS